MRTSSSFFTCRKYFWYHFSLFCSRFLLSNSSDSTHEKHSYYITTTRTTRTKKRSEMNNNNDSFSFMTEDQVKCYELLQSARMKDFIDVSFVRVCHQTVANAFPDLMADYGGFSGDKSDKIMNDTDRLNDIFRLCAQIGLANVIVHFIDEISNDANCVSADAVEARLRDGENIFQCMKGLMEEEKQEISVWQLGRWTQSLETSASTKPSNHL